MYDMSKSTPTPNKILTRCPVILVLLSYLDLVRSPSLLLGKLRGTTLTTTNMASSMRANVDLVSVTVRGSLAF